MTSLYHLIEELTDAKQSNVIVVRTIGTRIYRLRTQVKAGSMAVAVRSYRIRSTPLIIPTRITNMKFQTVEI